MSARIRLTDRLVTAEAMGKAIADLLSSCTSYIVILKRFPFDWRNGSSRPPFLVLDHENPPTLGPQLDERVVGAKSVTLIFRTDDGGVGRLGLTARSYEVLAGSPKVYTLLRNFAGDIRAGARSRLISLGTILFLVSWWVPFAFASVAIDMYADPGRRRLALDDIPDNDPSPSQWLSRLIVISFFVWIAGWVVATLIAALRGLSGGLRTWPEALTTRSILRGIYVVRSNITVPAFWTQIVTAIVSGIAVWIFVIFVLGKK